MSISEKLTTIAENEQKVFDAGKKSEAKCAWKGIQQNGTRTSYRSAFWSSFWDDSNFNPQYDLNVTDGYQMFRNSPITDLSGILERNGVVLNFSNASGSEPFQMCFYNSALTIIPDLDFSKATTLHDCFAYNYYMKTIKSLTVGENTKFSNVFLNCYALTNLIMKGTIGQNGFKVSYCTHLSHSSLMSIINCLQDKTSDTSGTSWVCSLGSTNLSKLTNEEKAIATEKGWSLA